MGFLRRLVEEGSKQINEAMNKKLQEAIEKLEKQAKNEGLHQGSSSNQRYNGSYSSPSNSYSIPHYNYENQNHNADQISQEQHLSNFRVQVANDQIRRAEENIDMLGTIGTNQSYVIRAERSRPNFTPSSTPPSGISHEQHLSNLRVQLANDQIRRAEESIDMLGTIGTNQSHVIRAERSRPSFNPSSTPPSGISHKQHLSNLRVQMANDQIRRMEENIMVMNTIGTNTRIEWVNGPCDGLGGI